MNRTVRLYFLLLLIALVGPACGVGYVLSSSYYQFELLSLREPIVKARLRGTLTRSQLRALNTIQRAREYGSTLGFKVSDIYTTVATEWGREMWNVSACDSLSFTPRRWWFPVVGNVPYLGFFSKQEAEVLYDELKQDPHLDVHKRRVGAYSTLGYFNDPILPGMLQWSSTSLLDLVFHELTHATVWLSSSVQFNESFANFVGEKATLHYFSAVYGKDSPQLKNAEARYEDKHRWRTLLWDLYKDLDQLFGDSDLSKQEKLLRKNRLYKSLPNRAARVDFKDLARIKRRINSQRWNNARLMQFKRYNSSHLHFEKIFRSFSSDFPGFFKRIEEIVKDSEDPKASLELAANRKLKQ